MDSPVDPNTIINPHMLEYMSHLLKINTANNKIKDSLFSGETLKCVNKSIHNSNYYMLDKYGLPMRKNSQDDNKKVFGWRYDEHHDPINIHINNILLQTHSNDIQQITIQQLKTRFPKDFTPKTGIVWRIYKNEFPDFNIETI